jgi:cytochrome c553
VSSQITMLVYRFHSCSQRFRCSFGERGRKLAVEGRSKVGVLPCATCHNNTGSFPRLAGQYAAYTSGQLRLWKAGIGPSTDGGATMMAIAQKLSDEDIKAVASYFETLPHE